MSFWSKIRGTLETAFQIGGALGPQFKSNSGNIDARNTADSAYINVRGLDPVISADFATKNYVDTHAGASSAPGTWYYIGPAVDVSVPVGQTLTFIGALGVDGMIELDGIIDAIP